MVITFVFLDLVAFQFPSVVTPRSVHLIVCTHNENSLYPQPKDTFSFRKLQKLYLFNIATPPIISLQLQSHNVFIVCYTRIG